MALRHAARYLHAPVGLRRCGLRAFALLGVASAALIGVPAPVAAQVSAAVAFEIVPATAAAGVARQVSVSLPWPSGCLPSGATEVGTNVARKRTLTIRLDGNLLNTTRCSDIIVNTRVTATVTPDSEGDLRALAVSSDGVYLGETTIHTRAASSDRSQYDLTGMWYDPATYGSGLTFIHGFTRNDTVFGTWYVYDAAGASRWYTIQTVQWKAGGLEAEGQVYETGANPVICAPSLCPPVAFATVMPLARARIVMQGANSARIDALSPGGALLFTSNIIRAIF